MTLPADGTRVVIRKRIAASREEVFRAWTDPHGMAAWMCPGDIQSSVVELDLRVGGALRVVMHSATEAFEHWGEFTVIEPPSTLAFTWCAKATGFQSSLVSVEIMAIDDHHCEVVLTHQGLPRQDIRDQYKHGWSEIVARLDASLTAR